MTVPHLSPICYRSPFVLYNWSSALFLCEVPVQFWACYSLVCAYGAGALNTQDLGGGTWHFFLWWCSMDLFYVITPATADP